MALKSGQSPAVDVKRLPRVFAQLVAKPIRTSHPYGSRPWRSARGRSLPGPWACFRPPENLRCPESVQVVGQQICGYPRWAPTPCGSARRRIGQTLCFLPVF